MATPRKPRRAFDGNPAGMNATPRFRLGAPKHGQCTHLTMTRLYTMEFRCAVCFREGPFGWLYRCTQDRELILEDAIDRGYPVEKLDSLCDAFDKLTAPRKRSPEARMSRLSFLEEISDDELRTYTTSQISHILHQRAQVLDLATESSTDYAPESRYQTPQSTNSDKSIFSTPTKTSVKKQHKPWLPVKGGECQFKCCHKCRPILAERAYLSLNGIVNNDIPLTAIRGFGFHLSKQRPVAPIRCVRNLGLRPSPPPRSRDEDDITLRVFLAQGSTISQHPDPFLGLGIFATKITYQPTPTTPDISSPAPYLAPDQSILGTSPTNIPSIDTSYGSTYYTSIKSATGDDSPLSSTSPDQQPELPQRPTLTTTPSFNFACSLPLPTPTRKELEPVEIPFTPMEKTELNNGRFGSRPLEVRDGVAVKEENVGGHWADIVTDV